MSKPELPQLKQGMRRGPRLEHLLKAALLAGIFVGKSSLALGACSPAPTITQTSTTQSSFWGLTLAAPSYEPWPTVSFGTVRTWNTWPTVAWQDINKWNGGYDWSASDAYVKLVRSKGKDIVYTFGYPPSWAGYPTANNLGPWINFVKAIVARYCNDIKYWELWNEPNSPNTWPGTTTDMVAMAKAAYPIIKNGGGIVVSPSPQGRYSYVWFNDYFSKGGNAYTDIVAIHGYTFGPAEGIVPFIQDVRKTMAAYGLSGKTLWDTEHSWWYESTGENQVQWISRHTILEASLGVNRSYWYMWDSAHPIIGRINDRNTDTILAPGRAYQTVYNWLIGNIVRCETAYYVYKCMVGSSRAIYWHSQGWPWTVNVDAKYTRTQNVYGTTGTIYNHKMNINGLPVMVE